MEFTYLLYKMRASYLENTLIINIKLTSQKGPSNHVLLYLLCVLFTRPLRTHDAGKLIADLPVTRWKVKVK